jgi:hypothetical protein
VYLNAISVLRTMENTPGTTWWVLMIMVMTMMMMMMMMTMTMMMMMMMMMMMTMMMMMMMMMMVVVVVMMMVLEHDLQNVPVQPYPRPIKARQASRKIEGEALTVE